MNEKYSSWEAAQDTGQGTHLEVREDPPARALEMSGTGKSENLAVVLFLDDVFNLFNL